MIGILAIQGDFSAHGRMLTQLSAPWCEVRNPSEIAGLSGLILPGGESTTMLHFLRAKNWMNSIYEFAHKGGSLFGTCAGAILLAREVLNPVQESMGLVDVSVIRNAYGRQVNSFVASSSCNFGWPDLEMVFIRAPRIHQTGPGTRVLAEYEGSPVLVQDGPHLLSTFHPELTADLRVHSHFLSTILKCSPTYEGGGKVGVGKEYQSEKRFQPPSNSPPS